MNLGKVIIFTSMHKTQPDLLKFLLILLLWIGLAALLFSAQFIISLAMIGMMVLGGYSAVKAKKIRLSWVYFLPVFLFFLTFLPPFPTDDWSYFTKRVVLKLPLLVLPLAFAQLEKWTFADFKTFLSGVVVIATIACGYVLFEYLVDFDAVQQGIHRGKALPTPSNHIRFSLTIVLTILAQIWALLNTPSRGNQRWRWLSGATAIFLIIMVHVLAVRSGLLTLYVGAVSLGMFRAWRQRKWKTAAFVVIMTVLVPLMAYWFVPSVQYKWDYLRADWQEINAGRGAGYSDGDRLQSFQVARHLFLAQPVLGTGIGNLPSRLATAYPAVFPDQAAVTTQRFKNPHSQYAFVLTTSGIVGFMLFLLIFTAMLRIYRHNNLWLVGFVVFGLSFLVENTLETNYGLSLFLIFYLVGGQCLNRDR